MNCANTEGIFRLIQSIPSPKAEPFKRWLAKVGYERMQEIEDPELATKRTRMLYQLEVVPNMLAAVVMSEDFLKHEIEEQFTAIIGEMIKRKK